MNVSHQGGLRPRPEPGAPWVALTREVSPTLARCELSHRPREVIDLDRAREQHAGYRRALAEAGAEVILLPAEERFPDAVFVEDGAVATEEAAVITRPGAASRRGEEESLAEALAAHRMLIRLQEPATLDGGDVLRIGRRIYVGLSGRTNPEGLHQLERALAPFGYETLGVEPRGCLHLKSAVASVAEGVLMANPAWVAPEVFVGQGIPVPDEEPDAANLLRVGGTLIVSDAYPRTVDLLARRGLSPRPVAVSEFHKAEGGLTCMSVVFRRKV